MNNAPHFTVRCALAGHEDGFETVTFTPEFHRGFNLAIGIQNSHDAHCDCATRIGNMYRIMGKRSDVGAIIKNEGEFRDCFREKIERYDFLCNHFPTQPAEECVNVVCDIDAPSSPVSSSSGRSSSIKHAWDWSDEESSSDGEHDRKRARTRSLSPISGSLHASFRSSVVTISLAARTLLDPFQNCLRLPYQGFDFRHRLSDPECSWLDNSRSILKLPDQFRHLLLRPPHFGKTSFLSALELYYDIREADDFGKSFGSLAVAMGDSQHNQDLCLFFELSCVAVISDLDEFVESFTSYIHAALYGFIREYASELEVPSPPTFVKCHEHDLLASTLSLVATSNHTLFVGIDDYDAPSRRRFFTDARELDEDCMTQRDIESYIDSFFWGPLQKGSAAIDKLLVAGTFHLQSPDLENLRLLGLDTAPGFASSCGFTEDLALEFAESFLGGKKPSIVELRRSCGAYTFPPPNGTDEAAEPVLHPRRFLSRMLELSPEPLLSGDADPFRLLSAIFKLLPVESDVPGAVTTSGLITLVATGAVHISEPLDAPLHRDGGVLPWSAMYYAGALTHDRQKPNTFRIASSAVLSLIHSHIDRLAEEQYDIQDSLSAATHDWKTNSDRTLFTEMLSDILQDQTARSLGTAHEPDLRGILELAMNNTFCGQPTHFVGPLELFSTTGVSRVRVKDPANKAARHWDLRTLTLRGMWCAANPNDAEPSVEALENLHEQLMEDDEEALLARPYASWSPVLDAMETVLVGTFLEAEPDVPLFVAVGGARILVGRRS